jgi:hypothetical protein
MLRRERLGPLRFRRTQLVDPGCGNPTALGDLKPGETVVDLGSGGGIDCFLAAKAGGESGSVIA